MDCPSFAGPVDVCFGWLIRILYTQFKRFLIVVCAFRMVYLVLRLSDKLALAEQNLTLAMGLKFEEINSQSESEARLNNGKQELSSSKQDLEDTTKKME